MIKSAWSTTLCDISRLTQDGSTTEGMITALDFLEDDTLLSNDLKEGWGGTSTYSFCYQNVFLGRKNIEYEFWKQKIETLFLGFVKKQNLMAQMLRFGLES